jgi:hypothetical protein
MTGALCDAQHGWVSNTDEGIREQPRCAGERGHPGTHWSASGLAWEKPDGCVWSWHDHARPRAPGRRHDGR